MMTLLLGALLLSVVLASNEALWQLNFEKKVEKALSRVSSVLDSTKQLGVASAVPHNYDDKYALVEALAATAVSAEWTALELLGIPQSSLSDLRTDSAAAPGNPRTFMHLHRSRSIELERVEEHQVEMGAKKTTSLFGLTSTEMTYRIVKTYFWDVHMEWSLTATRPLPKNSTKGNDGGNSPLGSSGNEHVTVLWESSANGQLKTNSETSPWPASQTFPPVSLDITWLLRHTDADGEAVFSIDRSNKACHTPRRNPETEQLVVFFGEAELWAAEIVRTLVDQWSSAVQPHEREPLLAALKNSLDTTLVPVLPIFQTSASTSSPDDAETSEATEFIAAESVSDIEDSGIDETGGTDVHQSAVMLSLSDQRAILSKQRFDLLEAIARLESAFTKESDSLVPRSAATFVLVLGHSRLISDAVADGVMYVEQMLMSQLIAAIGKEVTPADFDEYMVFNNRRLLVPQYQTELFSHAIRRPELFPEGMLSLESPTVDSSLWQPIHTITRKSESPDPVKFTLSAGTTVSLSGPRFLHAFVRHQFSQESLAPLRLVARARQFSSFILMVGQLASKDEFVPKAAVVVQNKDSLLLPLLLEQIPSAKEFRDSIHSLSPEQRRFAEAFRSMQLGSTLFSIVVVQIKPQLEALLNLPEHSLTKEILLTQQLMDLFIEYQIPPDLLSFDGEPGIFVRDKLEQVRQNVAKINSMIETMMPPPDPETKHEEEEDEMEEIVLSSSSFKKVKKTVMKRSRVEDHAPLPAASIPTSIELAVPQQKQKQQAPQPPSQPLPPEQAATQETGQQQTQTPPTQMQGDFAAIPQQLEQESGRLDLPLRPTIIRPSGEWQRASVDMRGREKVELLTAPQQEKERNKAFDLLDALSRSGALPIRAASLHVVLCVTHAFDKTLLDTLVMDNVNPIERVEESVLMIARTVHAVPVIDLVAPEQLPRLRAHIPRMLTSPATS